VIIFGSVFIKKSNWTEIIFFLKKKPKPNRNRVKPTGFGSVRFVFLGKKLVQTGLARFSRFFSVLARFFRFGSVFSVWLCFGSVFFPVFCRFRFGFFGFLLIKPKPNQTGWFFQKFNRFNRFFFRFGFFNYFFSSFLSLIGFPIFFLTPNNNNNWERHLSIVPYPNRGVLLKPIRILAWQEVTWTTHFMTRTQKSLETRALNMSMTDTNEEVRLWFSTREKAPKRF